MCNNGRRITKFVILVAALFSAFFVSFSCSNLFNDIKAPLTDGKTVTITGAVSNSQGEAGSKRVGRMALPSGAFAATEYTVTATAPGADSISGSVNSDNNTFSIALALGKQWTITISMKVKETESDTEFKQVFQGSYAYDHALTVADVTVPISIVLAPISGGNGTIKLPMSVASGVSAETVVISGLSDDPETYTLSDGAYTINKLGVPSGAYTVTIDFKNTAGLVIYSTTQTINVISNMTTRRWVSDGSSSPINGDGTFVVTAALVQAFATSQIYVGANPYQMHEPSDTNLGTPYEPLATVGEAIRRLTDSSKDYTIRISGTQVGPFTLGVTENVAPNFAARSVTLCGMTGNTTDILTVSGEATILTITTTAPATIRKLKISSGYNTSENSAGINMEAGSKLILEDGALITMNSGYMRGAGIYATGENTEIVMNSGSKVSGNELRYTSEGSYDFGGAGVYISGSGITDTTKLPKLTINTGAEISDNTAKSFCRGGGIYAENAIVSINGGKITGNKAGDCAGNIYVVGSDSSLTMTAGEISDGEVNSVESYGSYGTNAYGGGVVLFGGTFEMSGGKICNNKAIPDSSGSGYGVGITMGSATFIMTGGEISGNSVESEGTVIQGGAIKFEDTNAVFKIGGSAYIPYGVNGETGAGKNDIYVGENKKITIVSALTGTAPVATIVPASPSAGLTVLEKDTSVSAVDFAAACGKFALTNDEDWILGSDGKIRSIIDASNAASYIGNMTTGGTVTLSGTTEDISFSDINTALKALAQNNPSAKVTLDLSRIENLSIPDNWNSDQSMGFWGCDNIESVIFPDTLTNLGAYAFKDCTGLKSVVIPNSITVLNSSVFSGCTNLSSVTLPEGLTEIQYNVFGNCSSLTEVELPSTLKKITGSFNGSGLTKIIIPDGVTEITSSAFSQCKNLTEANIPNSVTTMTGATFNGCSSLTTVHLPENENYTKIETNTFNGCTSLSSIDIPQNVNTIGQCAFTGTGLSGELIIPEHVTTINMQAFSSCNGLTSVTLHNKFVQVGQSIFMNCTGLESVTIAGDFPIVDSGDAICVFKGCTSLREIDIQDGVTTIPGSTFNGCTSLTTIVLPNTVTVIDNQAFEDCTNLESISIPENVIEIDSFAFRRCGKLSGTLTIPASVKRIGKQIVADCSLSGVKFDDTISEWCQTTSMGFTGGTSIGAMSSNTATNLSTLQGSYYFYQPE